MATITFLITGIDSAGKPILKTNVNGPAVNGDVSCNTNDTIQWNINPNSGVTDICVKKTGGTNVFGDEGLQKRGNHNWYGVVANGTGGDEEDYSIAVGLCPEVKVWHDPKITVSAGHK